MLQWSNHVCWYFHAIIFSRDPTSPESSDSSGIHPSPEQDSKKRKRGILHQFPGSRVVEESISSSLEKLSLKAHLKTTNPAPAEFKRRDKTDGKRRSGETEAVYNLRRLVHAYGKQARYYLDGAEVLSNHRHNALVKVVLT